MNNTKIVLDILKDEANGDIASALKKMTGDYSMTWMYKKGETIFPSSSPDFSVEMKEIYPIKGRKYEIKNIAEGDGVVMVEMIESYPDPGTGKIYRTPVVIVVEIKNGKINRGRHYCDPDLSWLYLSKEEVDVGYKDTSTKEVIESDK